MTQRCLMCGAAETFPYKCSYCGQTFCGNHRLPEKHKCPSKLNRITKDGEVYLEPSVRKDAEEQAYINWLKKNFKP